MPELHEQGGVFINVSTLPEVILPSFNRGVAAIVLNLSWGDRGKFIRVPSMDFADGSASQLIGTKYQDVDGIEYDEHGSLTVTQGTDQAKNAKLLRALFEPGRANECVIFNPERPGASKARATAGELAMEARWVGDDGNKINIIINQVASSPDMFEVLTYFKGSRVDEQLVEVMGQLIDNDFVIFNPTDDTLAPPIADARLDLGSDGTARPDLLTYEEALALVERENADTFICISDNEDVQKSVSNFIITLYKTKSSHLYGVSSGFNPNHWKMRIGYNGLRIDGEDFPPHEAMVILGGAMCGSPLQGTIANTPVRGTNIQILNPLPNPTASLTDKQIQDVTNQGKNLFVVRPDDNSVIFYEDITSHTNITPTQNLLMTQADIMRAVEETMKRIKYTFNVYYRSKHRNNAVGRATVQAGLNNLLRVGLVETGILDTANLSLTAIEGKFKSVKVTLRAARSAFINRLEVDFILGR